MTFMFSPTFDKLLSARVVAVTAEIS